MRWRCCIELQVGIHGGSVWESQEGLGCPCDARCDQSGVRRTADGIWHRFVGELGVKVPQVIRPRLKRKSQNYITEVSNAHLLSASMTWFFLSPIQCNNCDGTYHVRVERRRELLGVQVIPVYWREEHVILDLSLPTKNKTSIRYKTDKKQSNHF